MRNPLLERQIKKFLNRQDISVPEDFLFAINEAYKNYEDQISMLQRALKVNSDELFEANSKLRQEAAILKEINGNLEMMLSALNTGISTQDAKEISVSEYIKKQAADILEITRQREQLLKNLEAQNQELNEYTHMVSHDLKAPLRNISTLVAWIIQESSDELSHSTKDLFNLVQSNLKKMDLLIAGMVDYSSIDKRESDDRLIDVELLLKDIFRKTDVPHTTKVTIMPDMPGIYGSVYRFTQLFENLISNAIKFNDKPNGEIEIGGEEKDNVVEFYIKDNGKGIPEAYHNKIFNIFTKLDNNSNASGIGLSIVKKIINYYNGSVWLDSKEQEGTTFFFSIPKTWNNPT